MVSLSVSVGKINFVAHICRTVAGFYVTGKSGNVHKSFKDELDAYVWLQAALLRGAIQLLN